MSAIDVAADQNFGARPGFGATPPEVEQPSTGDVAAAAFRQTNSVVSAISALRNSGEYEPVPGYNPIDDISSWKNEKYMREHGDRFVGSHSPADTYAIKDQIDTEDNDKNILAASGKTGFIAQTMAGMLDPTMLLPGGVGIDAAKGGLTFTKAAIETGKAGLLATTAQEALLHGSQQTRTYEESALNVASGTLLSAMIGGGASALLGRPAISDIRAGSGLPHDQPVGSTEPPSAASLTGFTAYHGSPHDFDAFSTSAIGTGEGAQVMGHGLYFAENPETANHYRLAIAGARGEKGHAYEVKINADPEHFLDLDKPAGEQAPVVREALDKLGVDPETKGRDVIDAINNGVYKDLIKKHTGEDGELDLDALNQEVAAKNINYSSMHSKILSDEGVRGTKFFDEGSREAGNGTRNFVVFNEGDIKITHKNGQPISHEDLIGQRATVEDKLAADRHEMNEHAGNPGTGEAVPEIAKTEEGIAGSLQVADGVDERIKAISDRIERIQDLPDEMYTDDIGRERDGLYRQLAAAKAEMNLSQVVPGSTSRVDAMGNVDPNTFHFPISDASGKKIGHIEYIMGSRAGDHDAITIRAAGIDDPSARGFGYGQKAYKKVVDWALGKGLDVYSSGDTNNFSNKVYERFKSQGYEVTKDSSTYKVSAGPSPEKIKSAAVKHGENIVESSIHADAMDELARVHGDEVWTDKSVEHGFTTTSGRFVGRGEAFEIANRNDQITQSATKGPPELHADQMTDVHDKVAADIFKDMPPIPGLTPLKQTDLPPESVETAVAARPAKPIATLVKDMTQDGSDAPVWRYTQSDLEEARQIHQEAVWRNHQVERSGFTVRFEANAKEMLDKIEAALPPKNITENITQPAGTGQAMAAGAASSDTRKLELVDFGLNQVPGLRRVIEKTSPMQRVFGADSPTARRTGADLAETSLLFKQNLQGEVTTAGPALDREARLMIHQGQVATGDALSKLFSEYRYGEQVRAPRMRAGFEDMTGRAAEGKMSFSEFKEAVSDAMRNGDKHEIPQVEQAAQLIRQKVFEPWKKRAIEAGLLPEDVDVKTADSYLSRLYNKQAIAAKRPEFVDRTTDWLQADQAAKAQAQQKISAYHGAMQSHAATIDKIQGQIAKLEKDADVVAARQEETTRFNKAANRRSEQLRESQYRNDGGIRVDVPGKGLENARGGSLFETLARNRGNLLADRASAKLSEIETLEQKLTTETASHDAMRGKLEEEIGKWEGKSTKEAQAALKARADAEQARAAAIAAGTSKSKGERLGSADKAVDRAVARILQSDRDLTRDELRSRAQEITDRIIGAPDGRLPYDLGMEHGTAHGGSGEAPRGALAAREFNIPDKTIADFLEHDIEHIIASHLKTMVPDVLLTEKFGDTRMTEAFRKINDEYAAMTDAAKSEKERTGLEKERQGVIDDLAAIRDRIRGTYAISSEAPLRNAARAANVLKNYNVLTSMGSAALSSLPDMAGSVLRHGLTSTFQDAWSPFFQFMTRQSDAWQEAGRQYRAMGIAVESVLASRHHALTDTLDTYHPQSRVERTMQWATGKFQFVNMLAPWTDFAKINASMVAGSELLRAVKAASEGSATARQLRNLGESGVEPHMADRIAKAFETGGEVRDGVHLPNTADWTDAEAKRVFEGAIARDVDIAVVTPGQEKPLWMSHPLLGIFGQFKSFTAAATERVLISNLQRRDAQVLQGMIFSMGLGMLSYKLNSLTGGQATSDKPQDWIKEAISRGNLLGWFEEANALASKSTRGGVDIYRMIGADKPLSRYASRSAMDQILGPTAGKIGGIIQGVQAAARPSEWNQSDSKAIRRLVAGQNVTYLRLLFDQVEKAGNNAFGIEMKAKPENR